MRRRGEGFTLAETLVAAALMGLVLMLGAQVVTPSLRIWNLDQARSAAEGTAMILERRMTAELLETSRESVTTSRAPVAVSFLEPAGYDPETGRTRWSGFIVYVLDDVNRILYRKTWPNPKAALQVPPLPHSFPRSDPVALTPAELRQVATTTNGSEVRSGRYVSDLQVSAGTATEPGRLLLEMRLPTQGGIESRQRRLDLVLRN